MNINKIKLWPDGRADENGFEPYLEYFPVPTAKPAGTVIICPGGGYSHRAPHEGAAVAERFNQFGLSAFVVHYRVAPARFPAPQQDILRAVRLVRCKSKQYNINPDKIAVCGFSAGGHLAASSGIFFNRVNSLARDAADQASPRPDALILCYPVISSGQFAHTGSFDNLLGKDADAAAREKLSLEQHVRQDTPPAFLWHTANDSGVPVENSLLFSSALSAKAIPFELHIFPAGRHGLGLAAEYPDIAVWPELCQSWLRGMNWY
jgi:acetyl esterase/lipase